MKARVKPQAKNLNEVGEDIFDSDLPALSKVISRFSRKQKFKHAILLKKFSEMVLFKILGGGKPDAVSLN